MATKKSDPGEKVPPSLIYQKGLTALRVKTAELELEVANLREEVTEISESLWAS